MILNDIFQLNKSRCHFACVCVSSIRISEWLTYQSIHKAIRDDKTFRLARWSEKRFILIIFVTIFTIGK